MERKRKTVNKPCAMNFRVSSQMRGKFDTLKSFYNFKTDTETIEMIIRSQFDEHIEYLNSFDTSKPTIAPLFDYIESIQDKT
jgi:hypothetical protein